MRYDSLSPVPSVVPSFALSWTRPLNFYSLFHFLRSMHLSLLSIPAGSFPISFILVLPWKPKSTFNCWICYKGYSLKKVHGSCHWTQVIHLYLGEICFPFVFSYFRSRCVGKKACDRLHTLRKLVALPFVTSWKTNIIAFPFFCISALSFFLREYEMLYAMLNRGYKSECRMAPRSLFNSTRSPLMFQVKRNLAEWR